MSRIGRVKCPSCVLVSVFCSTVYTSEKQARAYGNLGWCYQAMKQYPQAIFCHNKVHIFRSLES